jgi:DNA-binding NarL/FixJ family response regulator
MGPYFESEQDKTGMIPLSGREHEVLDLIVAGMTNRAAARRLGISERTVREHIARIFLKLRVASRVEAAVIATEWRLAERYGNLGAPQAAGA